MAVHPLGRRPRSWFGPDDYNDGDDINTEIAIRRRKQEEWDSQYAAMPWWKRWYSAFCGEVTEPVNTHY